MSESKINYNGGIGFFGFLTLLFIAFKITSVIDWSWWWVLSPILIPWAIIIAVIIVVIIVAAIISLIESRW